jgi:hypothetical protein
MDALTHNVESYLSPAYHPLCDGIALEGTRIAARALVTAVREPRNLQARADMMMASMMGAIAFQKDLGAVHSCAHALGAVCDLHHGLANALMIEPVMRFNQEAAPQKFAELAHVVGAPAAAASSPGWGSSSRPSASRRRWRRWGWKSSTWSGWSTSPSRRLPPDQSAAMHAHRFRAPVRGGDVKSSWPSAC